MGFPSPSARRIPHSGTIIGVTESIGALGTDHTIVLVAADIPVIGNRLGQYRRGLSSLNGLA
jgi:hypothetical protein